MKKTTAAIWFLVVSMITLWAMALTSVGPGQAIYVATYQLGAFVAFVGALVIYALKD